MNKHKETVDRFCHIIGKNAPVFRFDIDGETVYQCMNKHLCEKNGGCKNTRLGGTENDSVKK